jgi:hypothetical protein
MTEDYKFILGYFDRKLNAHCRQLDLSADYIFICRSDLLDFESAFIELRESALFKSSPKVRDSG